MPVEVFGRWRFRCSGGILNEAAHVFLRSDILQRSVIERDTVLLFELCLQLHAA